MTTTSNTAKTSTTKRPAARKSAATSTTKSTANTKQNATSTETVATEKKVSSAAVTAEKTTSEHIADQIKVFARRRVWPD